MGTIVSIVVALLVAAVVIYIVGRLNLGLSVASYGSAFIAAIVIAIVGGIILWLLELIGLDLGAVGGIWGALVYLVVSAIILMVSDKFLPGMAVSGFIGAVVAAVSIGVVNWIVSWIISLF